MGMFDQQIGLASTFGGALGSYAGTTTANTIGINYAGAIISIGDNQVYQYKPYQPYEAEVDMASGDIRNYLRAEIAKWCDNVLKF